MGGEGGGGVQRERVRNGKSYTSCGEVCKGLKI